MAENVIAALLDEVELANEMADDSAYQGSVGAARKEYKRMQGRIKFLRNIMWDLIGAVGPVSDDNQHPSTVSDDDLKFQTFRAVGLDYEQAIGPAPEKPEKESGK